MDHGIHYVSACRTFVFLSHCTLPYRCTSEADAHMHDHCQSTCRFLPLFFFNIFPLDATLPCILLAVVLSWFGHRPSYYTTSDPWFGLENPSDFKSSVISQISLSPSGRSLCLRAHTTQVTPVEPSAMLSTWWVYTLSPCNVCLIGILVLFNPGYFFIVVAPARHSLSRIICLYFFIIHGWPAAMSAIHIERIVCERITL